MKKKILVACLCVALAVLTIAGTTLAYLTSTAEVKNTFTVGNVSITMDEAKVDNLGKLLDKDDKPVTKIEDAARSDNNSYKLMPGLTYTKDPIIHVGTGSEDCYLFVTVKNEIANIEATGSTTVAAQMAAKGWVAVAGQTNLYVYVGTAADAAAPLAVAAGNNITVFEKIVIADTVTNDTLATYANKTIVVNAYAVQTAGFEGKDAATIWGATFGKN